MKPMPLLLSFAMGFAAPAGAQDAAPPRLPLAEAEVAQPDYPAVLDLREQAALIDRLLRDRLETVIPGIMRETGTALWIVTAREYFEDPVIATMLDAESMHARRRTILVFVDPGDGKPIERLTVSRYGLGGLFEPAWNPATQPDQWKAVAEIIAARDPATIAVNTSELTAFADGMTHSQYSALMAALPQNYRDRVVAGETLSLRWLESRTPAEMEIYPGIVRLAHALIGEAFSRKVITPGLTTADDVVWWYRRRLVELGLDTWFQPSVGIQRQGAKGMLEEDTVIQPGDLLWTDFGITYLRLSTDTQHLAYVLKPGETAAPAGLVRGLAASNRVQDILRGSFKTGLSGNEVLALARRHAVAEGIETAIYSHPIGFHGHGAGTAIGFWDNQADTPHGAYRIRPNTTWSIELTTYNRVPEWNDQTVDFRTEEDAWYDGDKVHFLDGRQTVLPLIPSDP